MSHYTKKDIMRLVEEEDVEFIRLQFTDLFGNLKNAAVTASQLEKVLDNRYVFDGSCVEGFLHDNDMFLCPDRDTLAIFPWRPQQGKVARLICDIQKRDGAPYEGDSRYILEKVLKDAEKLGYRFDVGPECEFFLFHIDENGKPTTQTHDQGGYFDLGPVDRGENCRRDICLALEEMGFEIEASHHEVAEAQHEIDFKYDEGLKVADDIMTFKLVVKTIAKRHGMYATFMPKPKYGVNGSGMHINMSLSKDGRNAFCDPDDKLGLSETAYQFIAGILEHVKGITAIANPLINSYKRLVPGYEAPVYIAWSATNRSPLIRIPASEGEGTRAELRSPDPTANPYLVLAVCLSAGLDGIRRKLKIPKAVNRNIYDMADSERINAGIDNLPENLMEAGIELANDEYLKKTLGTHITRVYLDNIKKEWREYSTQVTDWEIKQYLYKY